MGPLADRSMSASFGTMNHSLHIQALAARFERRLGKKLEAMNEKHGPEEGQRTGDAPRGGIEGEVWIALDTQGVARSIMKTRAWCEEDAATYGQGWRVTGPYVLRSGDGISVEKVPPELSFQDPAEPHVTPMRLLNREELLERYGDPRERAKPQSWVIRRSDGLYLDAMGGPTPPGEKQLPRWVPLEDAVTYRTEQAAVEDMLSHYWFETGPMRVVGIVLHPSWREALESSGGGEK